MAHADKVGASEIVADKRPGHYYCEQKEILPEAQCGFGRQRSTVDMIFVLRRLPNVDGK